MKRLGIHIVYALLISGIAAVATTAHNVPRYLDSGETFTTQRDVDGWVDPEDLVPMPQCIAQQDQSAWLGTMTKCARQRCTSQFPFFCTHHRWLTELSCLSVEFSPDAVENYVPYCSRSILAKAQLYHWIRNVTGRTWLVNVGDATGLQTLSPANLPQGYASTGVVSKAPACLSRSRASPSLESFEHVLASCTFTSTALHTGNAAHPWEYSTSRQSMIALSFDTAGYDLTGKHIPFNEYFDRECFCSAFVIDQRREPCLTADQLDLTKERLWLNATCGPASLPKNWTASLKMMRFKYIPFAGWHWPQHVTDMPKQVTILTERCATEACRLDSDGYCVAAPAVDRACFCSNIDYNSCQASCRFFESRIGFVKWLHELCGHVDGWHGLPTNWRELTTPLPGEMIPWRWFVRPNYSSATSTVLDPRSVAVDQCWSNEWILASIAFVNFATMLAPFFGKRRGYRSLTINPPLLHPLLCMLGATLLASLHLVANWFNAHIIQSTPGYETVPVFQLTLLWCSLPRLSWLTIAPAGVHRLRATEFFSSAVSLFAEMILQCFALYHMSLTINYGRQHNFYFGGLANTKSGRAAMLMYVGAFAWLTIIVVSYALAMRAIRKPNGPGSNCTPRSAMRRAKGVFATLLPKSWPTASTHSAREERITYGTLPTERKQSEPSEHCQGTFASLHSVMAISMPFIWVSQWLFWIGFINLSSNDFCLPSLRVLTIVWAASSMGIHFL